MRKSKLIKPDPTLKNNLMAFGYECTIPNALIIGENIEISKLKRGSSVLGINGNNENVIETFNRKYDGEMLEITGEGMLPFMVTPEHPVLAIENNWIEHSGTNINKKAVWNLAKDLIEKHHHKNGYSLIIPRIKPHVSISEIDLIPFRKSPKGVMSAEKIILSDNICWLMGLYVAEGSPSKQGIQFSLHKKETALRDRIIDISLNELNHPCSTFNSPISNGAITTIPSKILSRCFPVWCGKGAINKKIPEFILFHTNESFLRSFIDGYLLGDGCSLTNKGTNQCVANTVSKILVLQLQLAFGRLGIFAHIYNGKKSGYQIFKNRLINIHQQYSININLSAKRTFAKITDDSMIIPIRKIKKVKYSGIVSNIETTGNTYLLSNAVVHNCDKGWRPLIDECIEKLEEQVKKDKLDTEILQIKEKFGTLRIYLSSETDEISNIVERYELFSSHICELCGEFWTAKERVSHAWWKTLCDKCAKEHDWV